jgi:tripartite ATP-independent transporter DctP family solute receptor
MTVNQRRSVLRAGIACAGGLIGAPSLVTSAFGATPQKTFKLAFADVANSPIHAVLENFAARVKERTHDAVAIRVFSQGELGSQQNILTGMQVGVIDFCVHSTGFIQTLFPQVAVLDLPYIFKDEKTAETVLDGPVGTKLLKDMQAKGVYGLCWGQWGWRETSTVGRALEKPEAAKGMTIRVQPGSIYKATYSALGAIPVQIDASEIYIALSQHGADAIETPLPTVVAQKWYEVLKYVNLTRFVYNAGAMMMNQRKFDQLDSTQKSVIVDAAREMSSEWRKLAAVEDKKAIGFLKERGLQVLEVDRDAYGRKFDSVYAQFRTSIGPDFFDLATAAAKKA